MSAHLTAINAIEQYRDPSLDGLLENRAAANKKAVAHSRRSSSRSYDDHPELYSSLVSDVSERPTIAYPNSAGSDRLQRSFSQRARERPFADEAFRNDNLRDEEPDLTAMRTTATHQPDARPTELARNSSRPRSDGRTREQIIQDNIRSAAESVRSPLDTQPYVAAPASQTPNKIVASGVTRAATLRDAANQTDEEMRDWAPDRSPLQKLEVTLNDISKEEKRARVREAEMLLREKTRSRTSADRTVKPSMPTGSQRQVAIEDVGIVRNLSSTHKDRLQHSTTIDSHRPDPTRLSGDYSGFEYQAVAASPTRSVTITRTRGTTDVSTGRNGSITNRTVSNPQSHSRNDDARPTASTRSASGPHLRSARTSTGAAQMQSYSRNAHPVKGDDDRTPTAQERNASHKAALEQLTGSTSTRVSPKHVAHITGNTGRNEHQETVPTDTVTTATSDGYSVNRTPDMAAERSTIRHPGSVSMTAGRRPNKRNSSVSFKDPYERRRPVDEWKAVETARLNAADFQVEPTSRSLATGEEHDKAWWEADAKSRRKSG